MDRNMNHDDLRSGAGLHFACTLAPLLSEQLHLAGAPALALASAAALSKEAALPGTGHLTFSLRFEGALSGRCFLILDQPAAAALGGAEAPAQLLERALNTLCDPLAAALLVPYGSVRVSFAEKAELGEDWEPLALLHALDGTISLTLAADTELQRGLARLTRIAAAAEASGLSGANLGLVMDVELNVTLRFGQRQLPLREIMDLASGSVVELDREVDEPVELILDGRVIARGEAVIVDGNYGVRVTEVLQPMTL